MHGFKIKEPLKGELQKKAAAAEIKVQMTLRHTMVDAEWCRHFGPVLCTGAVPFPFLSGTVRGGILGFTFGLSTVLLRDSSTQMRAT